MEQVPAPLGAIIAAFIAGLFSFLGLVIAKENKVSEFRQAWIDALRADIARYSAAVSLLAHAQASWQDDQTITWDQYFKLMQPTVDVALAAQTSIMLRINPNDSDAQLSALNKALLNRIQEITAAINNDEYEEAARKAKALHLDATPILKREWGRVKAGERVYAVAKWLALTFVIASAAAMIAFLLRYETPAKAPPASETPGAATPRPSAARAGVDGLSPDSLRPLVC